MTRIYLTNTLDEAPKKSHLVMGQYISDEVSAALEIKRDKPVMVVLVNLPNSGHSANKDPWISGLLQDYYQADGQAMKERIYKGLKDEYVKFIRFGQWRIQETGQGVMALITNNGYLDSPTFRGMRQQLMNSCTEIYVLDLHDDAKKRERVSDGVPEENVFDIKQGMAIGIFVREPRKEGPAHVYHVDLWGIRDNKYDFLAHNSMNIAARSELQPTSPSYLFVPSDTGLA